MPQINQLTSTDTLNDGDLFIIFSTGNGDARSISASNVAKYMQTKLSATGGFMTQYSAPSATAFSVQVSPITNGGSVFLLLTPTGTFATGTISLPALAQSIDGQEVLVCCTQIVTALTVSGNGATVNGAPTTLAANGFFRMRFDGVFKAWYRV